MNETIGFVLDYAPEFLIAIVVIIVAHFAVPWLKEKRLYGIVEKFVRAAEKLEEGDYLSEPKICYVTSRLKQLGYEIDDTIRAYIEAAVKELDIECGDESNSNSNDNIAVIGFNGEEDQES